MSTYINEDQGKTFRIADVEAPPYVKEYLNYLMVVKNNTPHTVKTYYLQIQTFLRWAFLRDNGSPITLDMMESTETYNVPFDLIANMEAKDIYEYLSFAQNILGNMPSSRRTKLSALRSFYLYHIEVSKKLEKHPLIAIVSPKGEKKLPKFLSEEESMKLLSVIDGRYADRDYCIVTLLLNCGLRLSEVVSINLKDIKDDVLRVRGKGRKERIVYLNDACLAAIEDWLIFRESIKNHDTDPALFLSMNGKRITGRRIEQIVSNLFLKAGLTYMDFTTHSLRHTAATLMYNKSESADILALQQILGHENIATTRIYTHIGEDQVKDAMKTAPLSSIRKNGRQENDEIK